MAKSGDTENKKLICIYLFLKLIASDLEFFKEIEKFIQFTGDIKSSRQQKSEENLNKLVACRRRLH